MRKFSLSSKLSSILIILFLLTSLFSNSVHVSAAEQQQLSGTPTDQNANWLDMKNLSQSGTASQPWISSEQDGTVSAIWWDTYDGPRYSLKTKNNNWLAPKQLSALAGLKSPGSPAQLKNEWRVIGGNENPPVVFWVGNDGALYSIQKSILTETGWTNTQKIITDPLVWDAVIDSNGGLHMVFIQNVDNDTGAAGVYYVHSWTGESWTEPVLLAESRYFRSLKADQAYAGIAVSDDRKVVVTWKKPDTGLVEMAISLDWGINFQIKNIAYGTDQLNDQQIYPQKVRPIALPDNSFLMLWEINNSCAMYQQIMTVTYKIGQNSNTAQTPSPSSFYLLTEPVRVLEKMQGCLATYEATQYDGNVVLIGNLISQSGSDGNSAVILLWDGVNWRGPETPTVNFFDQPSNQVITLGCLDFSLTNDKIWAIGCDNRGDVWAAQSVKNVTALLSAQLNAWQLPWLVSRSSNAITSMPSITFDSHGTTHLVWADKEKGICYSSLSGELQNPTVIMRSEGANTFWSPVIARSIDEKLILMWSSSPGGQIFYSSAFVRDANKINGWQGKMPISDQLVGGWPAVSESGDGSIRVVYSVPYNQNRGVYTSKYDPQKEKWTPPKSVILSSSEIYMIRDTNFATENGVIHVVWVESGFPPSSDPMGVYYSKSIDGGITWSDSKRLSYADGDKPRIIIDSNNIHVVWIRKSVAGIELWHQYSTDSGDRWSEAKRVDVNGPFAENVNIISDHTGGMFLSLVEEVQKGTAVITVMRWNGVEWGSKEQIYLGTELLTEGGTTSAISDNGKLVIAYWAKNGIGYITRPITGGTVIKAIPTLTLQPTPTITSTPFVIGTPSPAPTVINDGNNDTGSRLLDWRLWAVLIGVVVIAVIAGVNLIRTRQR